MMATITTAMISMTTINTAITMPATAPDDNTCSCLRCSLGGGTGTLVVGNCKLVGISLVFLVPVVVVVVMKASTN